VDRFNGLECTSVAFVSLVWSEGLRAYISRSFTNPIWVKMCDNQTMQKAVGMAQVMLAVAVLIPGLNEDILKLSGYTIGIGWVIAFAGPLGCLFLCEVWKIVTGWQIAAYQKKMQEEQARAAMNRKDDQNLVKLAEMTKVMEDSRQKIVELERQISEGPEAAKV